MKFETRVSNLENERKVRQIERQHSCWKAFNQMKQKELSKLKRELEKKKRERER
jgi:nitrogen fixation/metabolism regulation signal transduction histidine kinase